MISDGKTINEFPTSQQVQFITGRHLAAERKQKEPMSNEQAKSDPVGSTIAVSTSDSANRLWNTCDNTLTKQQIESVFVAEEFQQHSPDDDDEESSVVSAIDELEDIQLERERISKIRSIVRKEVERKIKAKCISLSSFDPRQEGCNPSMVESMSKRVEGQLFETRASLESYVDLSTLDARLQALALVKKIQSDHDSDVDPRQRTEYLVQILGGIGRYRQIQKVLKDIRDEQQNFETIGGGAVGGRVMTEGMPDAVRDLFVESGPLQHAFEKAPMELLGQLDWTFLIARTQAILRTYREWNGDVLL